MLIGNDNFELFAENEVLELALFSTVGGRPDQQDSAGYELGPDGVIAVVCDGMGGHDGGKLASSLAVSEMLRLYIQRDGSKPFSELLMDSAELIDRQITQLRFDSGAPMQAGTTIVCAAVQGRSLSYLSVGDSRIYLWRGGQLYCLTVDHNYYTKLRAEYQNGRMSAGQYEAELCNGEALVSFLGVGGLSMMDSNRQPIELLPGDRLLLTTDGMYKLLPDCVIGEILENFSSISEALRAAELKAQSIAAQHGISRDNMTAALISIKAPAALAF